VEARQVARRPATDTIDYVVTDQAGLSTRTRTVIIQAANYNHASTTPANDNAPLNATGTTATTSSQ
jgi:hypothetical protein